MYKIVDPHSEAFTTAYRYLTVQRDWMESIGYWGVPGTPATGEEPVPVRPINVPTEESAAAYKTKYPEGYFKAYVATSTFVAPTSTTIEDAKNATSTNTTQVVEFLDQMHGPGALAGALLAGVFLGMAIVYWCFPRRPSGYQPIV